MIMQTSFISHTDGTQFTEKMRESIADMQNAGFHVEVQYKPMIMESGPLWTVMLIARVKGELSNEQ